MFCLLCQQDKKLVCSHIIPKAFYRSAYPENNGLMVSENEYSKKLPIGIYDQEILCADCEELFSPWDDYGNDFFCNKLSSEQKIFRKDNEIFYIIKNIDYDKLKLFLLSILWRGAVSTHSFFEQIKLGPFEKKIKQMIIDVNPGDAHDFECIIYKFNSDKYDILHPPHKIKFNNINGYKIFFFNAGVFVKVDQRNLLDFKSLILSPNQPLLIPYAEPPEVIRQLNRNR